MNHVIDHIFHARPPYPHKIHCLQVEHHFLGVNAHVLHHYRQKKKLPPICGTTIFLTSYSRWPVVGINTLTPRWARAISCRCGWTTAAGESVGAYSSSWYNGPLWLHFYALCTVNRLCGVLSSTVYLIVVEARPVKTNWSRDAF